MRSRNEGRCTVSLLEYLWIRTLYNGPVGDVLSVSEGGKSQLTEVATF